MPPFGGAPKCATCSKSVYFAEEQRGPGGKVYHKGCLRCLSCNKSLDALHLVDHDGDPYCKACHSKSFGPKGYGNGGALVGEYTDRFSPSPSPSPLNSPLPIPAHKPTVPTKPTFTSPSLSHPRQSFPSPSPLSARHDAEPGLLERAESPTQSSAASTADSESGGWRGRESVGGRPVVRGGGGGIAKYGGGGGGDLCRRCGTVVYFAESVLAAGQKWHKRCLRCATCETTLSSSSLTDRDGLPFCKKCYNVQFGLQSQGLMSRPGLY